MAGYNWSNNAIFILCENGKQTYWQLEQNIPFQEAADTLNHLKHKEFFQEFVLVKQEASSGEVVG